MAGALAGALHGRSGIPTRWHDNIDNGPGGRGQIVQVTSRLGSFSLEGCEIYTSCEPCPMCFAAIYWSRLERIYYAAMCEDAVEVGFEDTPFHRQVELPAGCGPMHSQDLRDEACEVFAAWRRKEDRIAY